MRLELEAIQERSKPYEFEIGLLRRAYQLGRKPLRRVSSILKRIYSRQRPYFICSAEGARFVGDFGDAYARGCAVGWQNEHITAQIIADHYRGPGAYVDVGSNMALLASQVARRLPDAAIYCFEPHPETARRAAATLALNDIRHAKLYQAAVGDQAGVLPLYFEQGRSEGSTLGGSVLKHAAAPVEVPCITLDDLVAAESGLQVGFLKVDVEGYEPQVFKGADCLLREQSPPILFEINFPIADKLGWTQQDIGKQLSAYGYEKFEAFDGDGHSVGWPAPVEEETVNVLVLR